MDGECLCSNPPTKKLILRMVVSYGDFMGSMPVFFWDLEVGPIILFFGMFFLMLSRFYIWMFPKHRGGGCLPPKMDVLFVFFGKPYEQMG